MAASAAVFLVPLVWLRLFSPIQYQAGAMLFCVSTALSCGPCTDYVLSTTDNLGPHCWLLLDRRPFVGHWVSWSWLDSRLEEMDPGCHW